jgi:hypothetical protein
VTSNIIVFPGLHKIHSKCYKQFHTRQTSSLDLSNSSPSIRAGMTVKSPVWDLFFCNKTHYKNDKSHCNAWCIGCLKLAKKQLRDADEEAICAGLLGEGRTEDELHEKGQTSWNKLYIGLETYGSQISIGTCNTNCRQGTSAYTPYEVMCPSATHQFGHKSARNSARKNGRDRKQRK